jgi:hypothetical protein
MNTDYVKNHPQIHRFTQIGAQEWSSGAETVSEIISENLCNLWT